MGGNLFKLNTRFLCYYSKNGKKAFWDAIHSEEYLNQLTAYGAYEDKELAGIIATRNEGTHIALFFVDGKYHRQGIGRSLWDTVLAENTSPTITVHSSLYAVDIYKRLGFVITDEVQNNGDIPYVPMEYKMITKYSSKHSANGNLIDFI